MFLYSWSPLHVGNMIWVINFCGGTPPNSFNFRWKKCGLRFVNIVCYTLEHSWTMPSKNIYDLDWLDQKKNKFSSALRNFSFGAFVGLEPLKRHDSYKSDFVLTAILQNSDTTLEQSPCFCLVVVKYFGQFLWSQLRFSVCQVIRIVSGNQQHPSSWLKTQPSPLTSLWLLYLLTAQLKIQGNTVFLNKWDFDYVVSGSKNSPSKQINSQKQLNLPNEPR